MWKNINFWQILTAPHMWTGLSTPIFNCKQLRGKATPEETIFWCVLTHFARMRTQASEQKSTKIQEISPWRTKAHTPKRYFISFSCRVGKPPNAQTFEISQPFWTSRNIQISIFSDFDRGEPNLRKVQKSLIFAFFRYFWSFFESFTTLADRETFEIVVIVCTYA